MTCTVLHSCSLMIAHLLIRKSYQARWTAPNRAVRMSGSVCVYAMRRRSSRVLEHTMLPLAELATTPPVLHKQHPYLGQA